MSGSDGTGRAHAEDVQNSMDSAGGCTEAWESLSELRNDGEEDSPARRTILQRIAGGVLGIPTLAVFDGESDEVPEAQNSDGSSKLTPVSRHERFTVLRELRATDEFQKIRQYIGARNHGVSFKPRSATVVRGENADGDELEVGFAEVTIRGGEYDEAHITLGRTVESQDVVVAGLEFVKTAVRGPEDFGDAAPQSTGRRTEVRVEVKAVDALDGMSEEVIDIDPRTTVKQAHSPDVATAGFGDGGAVESYDFYCTTCKADVTMICTYGCGYPLWALCGFLGITTVGGGLTCATFVGAVCGAASIYGCSGTGFDEHVCSQDPIDFC